MKKKLKFRAVGWRNAIYVAVVSLIILCLLTWGGWRVFDGKFITGPIMFLLGAFMCIGYSTPNQSPTTIWLLTFLGKKTTIVARRISYLIPGIVDKVDFSLLKKDHNFMLKKAVRCHDGSYLLKFDNFISATVVADDTDDDPDHVPEPKTAGQKLFDLDDSGGLDGATQIMDDLFTLVIEKIANEPTRTALWMETHGLEIAQDLRPRLLGLPVPPNHCLLSAAVARDFDEQDDVRGTGITFKKFAPVFQRSKEVIAKANEVNVEEEERKVEAIDTATMHNRIRSRIAEWKSITGKKESDPEFPGFNTFRDQLIEETLLRQGKFVKVENRGGANIVAVPTPTPAPAPAGGPI